MKAEEERKIKAQIKQQEKEERERERRKRAIKREKAEAKACGELLLIYPLVPYAKQFWIEDNYPKEVINLKKEIQAKKEAGDNADKVDFDL